MVLIPPNTQADWPQKICVAVPVVVEEPLLNVVDTSRWF
jgi:hypothetical protein